MSAREVDRSGDAVTSKPRKAPPARMRNYRIVAQPRTEPDLHELAQLFIRMAFARADAERQERRGPTASPRQESPKDVGN
ncbi:MAG: hypothetical protein IPK37_15030 [Austwickia sp.]|nr:MAG: hypothetical protein IPK37_15030 [Austwickia sp.]